MDGLLATLNRRRNDETVAVSERFGSQDVKNMYDILITATIALYCVLAAKKKPIFGQLTLTGKLAVDWLKPKTEVTVRKITFCNPQLMTDEWNLPEWVMNKTTIALIFPLSEWENPIMVNQASVLKWLEARCVLWEEAGAAVSASKHQQHVEFDANHPVMTFNRDEKAGKFAPYLCAIK